MQQWKKLTLKWIITDNYYNFTAYFFGWDFFLITQKAEKAEFGLAASGKPSIRMARISSENAQSVGYPVKICNLSDIRWISSIFRISIIRILGFRGWRVRKDWTPPLYRLLHEAGDLSPWWRKKKLELKQVKDLTIQLIN